MPRMSQDRAKDWTQVPISRPFCSTSHADNSRGIGLIDMALAIAEGRPARASGAMALHALDVMQQMMTSAAEQRFGVPSTTFDRPAPLPSDFPVR